MSSAKNKGSAGEREFASTSFGSGTTFQRFPGREDFPIPCVRCGAPTPDTYCSAHRLDGDQAQIDDQPRIHNPGETTMSSVKIDLTPAASYIRTNGWVKGYMFDGDKACLTGACQKALEQPGDWLLARAVLRAEDSAERFNDAPSTTRKAVLAVLDGRVLTGRDMRKVFGPNWRDVVALVRRAAVLTVDEAQSPDAAPDAALAAARAAAWDAALDAARAWDAALDAAWGAAWGATWDAAAARDAARAVVIQDLIGQHGYTQEHHDILTKPWREVVGEPLHPGELVRRGR